MFFFFNTRGLFGPKKYIFSPPSENDIFPPLAAPRFLTPIAVFYSSRLCTYYILLLPLFSFSFPFLPFSFPFFFFLSHFPPFSLPLFIFSPKMTLADISTGGRGGGYLPIYRTLFIMEIYLSPWYPCNGVKSQQRIRRTSKNSGVLRTYFQYSYLLLICSAASTAFKYSRENVRNFQQIFLTVHIRINYCSIPGKCANKHSQIGLKYGQITVRLLMYIQSPNSSTFNAG